MNGRIFIHLIQVKNSIPIIFFLTIFPILFFGTLNAQETPPVTAPPKDSLIDIKRPSYLERMAEKYAKDTIVPNKKGIVAKPGSTIGVGYRIRSTKHNQVPYGSQHSLTINYGVTRGAFFLEHKSDFYQVIGNWSLHLLSRADLTNVINFYGRGNESKALREEDYYQLKSKEYLVSLGFGTWLGKLHEVDAMGFFQSIKLNAEDSNYAITIFPGLKTNAVRKNFLGVATGYRFNKKDNEIAPTRGIEVGGRAAFFGNLNASEDGFWRFTSFISTYIPLNRYLTLASRLGGATITGNPEFYQLNILGGRENLRGYPRQRFYGTSSLFTNQELRLLIPTSKKFFRKIGLLAFADAGRVWEKGEQSNKLHIGYGGGFVMIPFNKIVLNASYGFSEEDRMTHLRVGYLF